MNYCDPFNGEFTDSIKTALTAPVAGINLPFTLNYNSLEAQDILNQTSSTSTPPPTSPFGIGFSSNLSMQLTLQVNAVSNSSLPSTYSSIISFSTTYNCTATITQENGSEVSYTTSISIPIGSVGSSPCAGEPWTAVNVNTSSTPTTITTATFLYSKPYFVLSRNDGTENFYFTGISSINVGTYTGTLSKITDGNGNTTTFTTVSPGVNTCPPQSSEVASCTVITDITSGQSLTLVKNSNFQVIEAIDPMGRTEQFSYNSSDQLTGITDPLGKLTSFSYTAASNNSPSLPSLLSSITYPDGQPITTSSGISLPATPLTSSTYGSSPLELGSSYSSSSYYPIVSQTDGNGNTTYYCYYPYNGEFSLYTNTNNFTENNSTECPSNGIGDAQSIYQSLENYYQENHYSDHPFDTNEKPLFATLVVLPNGSVTGYLYRADGNVLEAEATGVGTPQMATWFYGYFICQPGTNTNSLSVMEPCQVVAPNGSVTYLSYDLEGNITSYTNPDGETTTYTYNQYNEVVDVIPPASSSLPETTYLYGGGTTGIVNGTLQDSSDLLTSVIQDGGTGGETTTTYTYGDPAYPTNVTAITDPNGAVWRYEYDTHGDIVATIDPKGDVTTYTYNADGQVTSSTSPKGYLMSVGLPDTLSGNLTGIVVGNNNAYVVNTSSSTVTAINLTNGQPGQPLKVGDTPVMIALANVPNLGEKLYVSNVLSGQVTPITPIDSATPPAVLSSDVPISVGENPIGIATTPDGTSALVVNNVDPGTVTPINLTNDQPGQAIYVGSKPIDVAITSTNTSSTYRAYVTDAGSDEVTPLTETGGTWSAGYPISLPGTPIMITATPTMAYVTTVTNTSTGSGEVIPIDLANNQPQTPIKVGNWPIGIAVSSNGGGSLGGALYVANAGSGTVSVISTASSSVVDTIPVGFEPFDVAVSPNGATVYVTEYGSDPVILPINTQTNMPETPIQTSTTQQVPTPSTSPTCGNSPCIPFLPPAVVTPQKGCPNIHGKTAYIYHSREQKIAFVADKTGDAIVPVDLSTCTTGNPIVLGVTPDTLVASRNGKQLYVVSFSSGELFVINTETQKIIHSLYIGTEDVKSSTLIKGMLALSPNGSTLYATGGLGSSNLIVVNLKTMTLETPIQVGNSPVGITVSKNGKYGYVTNFDQGTLTPVNLVTKQVGTPVQTGQGALLPSLAEAQNEAYVTNWFSGTVTPVSISIPDTKNGVPTLTAAPPVQVGSNPAGIGIDGDRIAVSVYSSNLVLLLKDNTIHTYKLPSKCSLTLSSLYCKLLSHLVAVANKCSGLPHETFYCHSLERLASIFGLKGSTSHDIKEVSSYKVPSPLGISLSKDNRYGYVTSYIQGNLVPINLKTSKVGPNIFVGPTPTSIALASVAIPKTCKANRNFTKSFKKNNHWPNQSSTCDKHASPSDPPSLYTTTYTYNNAGELASTTTPPTPASPSGITTSYTYDKDGNVLSVTTPSGTTTYQYNKDDQLASVTDGSGTVQAAITDYSYDSLGNVVSSTNPNGNITSYQYNNPAYPSLPTSVTDPLARTTSYSYDIAGQLTGETTPISQQGFFYDPAGRLVRSLAISPSKQLLVGDMGGAQVTPVDLQNGTSTPGTPISVGQDPTDIVVSADGTKAYVANYGQGKGNTVSVIDTATDQVTDTIPIAGPSAPPAGPVGLALSLSPNAQYLYVTDSSNATVSVVSTATNTVVTTIKVPGIPILMTESPDGKWLYVSDIVVVPVIGVGPTPGNIAVISTSNSTSCVLYTVCRTLTSPNIYSPEGSAISSDGSTLYVANTSQNGTSGSLDIINTTTGQISSVSLPSPAYTVALSPNGNYAYVPEFSDNAVAVINTTTDSIITTITGSANNVLDNPFDIVVGPLGDHAWVTNPANSTVSELNLTTDKVIATIGTPTTASCSAATSSNTFCEPGLMALALVPSINTTYQYNQGGQLTQMTDPTGTTTYSYDGLGRLVSETDGAGKTVSYGYDNNGNLVCVAYPIAPNPTCSSPPSPSNTVLDYTYNQTGEMTSMTDWLSNTTSYTYDPNGNLQSVIYPASTQPSLDSQWLGYDNANDYTGDMISEGTPGNLNWYIEDGWNQDVTGRFSSNTVLINGELQSQMSSGYSYDPLSRVTSSWPQASYGYSLASQLTSIVPSNPSSPSTFNSYDSAGELCYSSSVQPSSGVAQSGCGLGSPPNYPSDTIPTYSYNQIGERTCATPANQFGVTCQNPNSSLSTTYGYDLRGNMNCLTPGNQFGATCQNPNSQASYTYSYNADGLRMSETSPDATGQQFVWNTLSDQLLMDGSNAYIYGPQGTAPTEQISLSSPTSSTSVTYLYSDPEGVRFTFNSSGNLTGEATYNAYGNVTSGGVSSITPFGYAGGYTDPTGLIYLIHRYYDPVTGQFTSVDPLVAISGQPYVYAGGDPVNGSDPSGLAWYDIFNPFSPNNPIRENAENGGFPSQLIQTFDPTYLAISGYMNEAEAAENGCGFWTEAKYGIKGVFGVAGTELFGLGGAGAVGDLAGGAADAGADSITGFTQHGLEQALGRDGGVGVSDSAMADAVENPVEVEEQSGGRTLYVGTNATVVLNSDGEVITTWANNSAGWRNVP
ncbi:MAG: hypothetical protein M1152_05330 [Actinobacteria bacterium]|nr:hypothetical protein [Actinomycetota bacterium]